MKMKCIQQSPNRFCGQFGNMFFIFLRFGLLVSRNEVKRLWDTLITDQRGCLEYWQFVRTFAYSMDSAGNDRFIFFIPLFVYLPTRSFMKTVSFFIRFSLSKRKNFATQERGQRFHDAIEQAQQRQTHAARSTEVKYRLSLGNALGRVHRYRQRRSWDRVEKRLQGTKSQFLTSLQLDYSFNII